MKKGNMKDTLELCKEYSKHIMSDVTSILDEKKVKYTLKGKSEIFVENNNDIHNLLKNEVNAPKEVILLLLDFTTVKSGTYIRLKREAS